MLGKRVMVVDDEDHICRVVALKLRGAGYRVTTAPDAESAIAATLADRPDLLITDFQMPGLSGLDLCRVLENPAGGKACPSPGEGGVPAVLLTARSFELTGRDDIPTNVRRIVSKPFSPRGLVHLVRELLGEAA